MTDNQQPKPPLGNGHDPQMAPRVITPQQLQVQLESWIGPMLSFYFRGLSSCCPGVPTTEIMKAASRGMGKLVGITYSGMNAPLGPLLIARKECREAFEAGIAEIKPNMPGGGANQPPPPMPAPPGEK